MSPSILTRSVVAVASLALGSVALAANPATAAGAKAATTPAGVTRDMVLSAAAGFRGEGDPLSAYKAMFAMVNRACSVDTDSGERIDVDEADAPDVIPASTRSNADAVVILADIESLFSGTKRQCIVLAVAATEPGFTLTGNSTLTVETQPAGDGPILMKAAAGPATLVTPLSGDVSTTTFKVPAGEEAADGTFSVNGSSVKITTVTTSKKVPDKKTKAEKKKAKKTYAKRLKAAKAKYEKALDRAGSSKTKKAAAKKAYSKRKSSAKAKYKYAIANYRIVRKTTSTTDSRPFTLTPQVL
jgi:hypothetical protein